MSASLADQINLALVTWTSCSLRKFWYLIDRLLLGQGFNEDGEMINYWLSNVTAPSNFNICTSHIWSLVLPNFHSDRMQLHLTERTLWLTKSSSACLVGCFQQILLLIWLFYAIRLISWRSWQNLLPTPLWRQKNEFQSTGSTSVWCISILCYELCVTLCCLEETNKY